MNKSAIKNFAVSARKKLIEQVMQKAFQIGITAKSITELKQEAGHIILNNIPQDTGDIQIGADDGFLWGK